MQNSLPTKTKINEIKNSGYTLDFGTVFEGAVENYKKIVWYAGLMLILFILVFTILGITGLFGFLVIESIKDLEKINNQLTRFIQLPTVDKIKINSYILFFSALISPFFAGFFKMADYGKNDYKFDFSNMFSYYKTPYVIDIFLSTIILGIVSTGITMFFESFGFIFLTNIISIAISIFTQLTIPLIVFKNLKAIEAIKLSIIVIAKKPLLFTGLFIISVIIAFLGFFLFCFGIFFTIPFFYSMNYMIYENIFGQDETSEIDQISGM